MENFSQGSEKKPICYSHHHCEYFPRQDVSRQKKQVVYLEKCLVGREENNHLLSFVICKHHIRVMNLFYILLSILPASGRQIELIMRLGSITVGRVDGDRGDPIPDQVYIKKIEHLTFEHRTVLRRRMEKDFPKDQ